MGEKKSVSGSGRKRAAYTARKLKNQLYISTRSFLNIRKNQQCLFIVGTPRAGTYLLSSFLNSLQRIRIAGEILNPDSPKGIGRNKYNHEKIFNHINKALKSIYEDVSGAKILLNHLEYYGITYKQLGEYFPDAKCVILYRKSLGDQYISYKLAMMSRKWIGKSERDRQEGKIRVDLKDFAAYCRKIRKHYDEILNNPITRQRGRVISYEELFDDPHYTINANILPMLGMSESVVRTGMQKQNTRRREDAVENIREVAGRLDAERQKYKL